MAALHRVHTPDLDLAYLEEGEGFPVILLHGFPDFWYSWHGQIDALAEAGFRVIAPDQRLYRRTGVAMEHQPVKPVSYVVAKTALLGLTRYLATYWAERNVRVNALCPGGVRRDQPEDFLEAIGLRIPMGRMAAPDEYQGAVLFLVSDASSYMTGSIVIADGGRSAW